MKIDVCKLCRITGLTLVFAAVVLLAIRSLTIDFFQDIKHKSFLPPAGEIMESDLSKFSFAVASDTGGKNEPIERVIRDVGKSTDAKFMLHLGDLVRYRNPSHYDWIADEVDVKLKDMPMYLVPGNHEIESEDGVIEKYLYTEKFGQLYYWFGYGNTLFIGLDSSEEKYDEEQLKWLKTVLNKIRPDYENCIIYSHVPPISPVGEYKKKLAEESRDSFAKAIKGHGINLLLSGHVHYFSRSEFEGIPLVTLMPSGQDFRGEEKQFGYVLVGVDGKSISIEDKYVKTSGETDYFEIFMSSAMVKDEVKYVAFGFVFLGVLLMIIGRRRKGL